MAKRPEPVYAWRDWLYEDEFNRCEFLDTEIDRLQKTKETLLDERRRMMFRAVARANRELKRGTG